MLGAQQKPIEYHDMFQSMTCAITIIDSYGLIEAQNNNKELIRMSYFFIRLERKTFSVFDRNWKEDFSTPNLDQSRNNPYKTQAELITSIVYT